MTTTTLNPRTISIQTSASPAAAAGDWPRTGRAISGFVALFLLLDGALRLAGFAPYLEGTIKAGYPAEVSPWIGVALLLSTLLYVLPRTAVLGAILVTGYLGGAVATHVRMEQPWFFPFVFGVLAWAGLYLRDARIRALLPPR